MKGSFHRSRRLVSGRQCFGGNWANSGHGGEMLQVADTLPGETDSLSALILNSYLSDTGGTFPVSAIAVLTETYSSGFSVVSMGQPHKACWEER